MSDSNRDEYDRKGGDDNEAFDDVEVGPAEGGRKLDRHRNEIEPECWHCGHDRNELPDGKNILARLAIPFTKRIPKMWQLWRGCAMAGVRGMRKGTGGDAVAMVGRADGSVEPVPVKWRDASHHDEDVAKWVSVDGMEEWAAGPEGRGVDLWGGSTPVIWVSEDSHEIGSEVQARVAECWDLGQKDTLYQNPQVEQILVDAGDEYDTAGAAVADGGVEVVDRRLVSNGDLVDKLVDIGSPGDSDGIRISWRKYTELYPERPSSEEYQMQETRGRIAEQDGDREVMWWKVGLLILGAVAITLFGMWLVGGGGSGGGGGISVPLGLIGAAVGGL